MCLEAAFFGTKALSAHLKMIGLAIERSRADFANQVLTSTLLGANQSFGFGFADASVRAKLEAQPSLECDSTILARQQMHRSILSEKSG